MRELLTPEQRRKLPPQILNLLDRRYLVSIRNGTGTYVGGGPTGFFGGGGGALRSAAARPWSSRAASPHETPPPPRPAGPRPGAGLARRRAGPGRGRAPARRVADRRDRRCRRITTASAVSTEPLGSITGVRELPDGRVLVNDGARRRLLLMDTTLKTVGVVLDSLTDVANAYGTRAGALIPYRADSTLFVDPASYAMLVLDPAGKVARVRSVWRVQDLPVASPARASRGGPGWTRRGRIVYRIPARAAPPRVRPPRGRAVLPPGARLRVRRRRGPGDADAGHAGLHPQSRSRP